MAEEDPELDPILDESFVAGASFREPTLRNRQLEAERQAARERAVRYRAELDLGVEQARRARRHRWRNRSHSNSWTPPGSPRRPPGRTRQIIGVLIVVVVLLSAYIPTHLLGSHEKTSLMGPHPTLDTSCSSYAYPLGAAYRFEACLDGQPIHWPRCTTLAVSIDPTNAPTGWSTDVDDALSQVRDATGLRLDRVSRGGAIAINWDSALVLRGFGHADKAGITSLAMRSTFSGVAFKSATIEISSQLAGGTARNGEIPVLLHELGHAVGLGHYSGPEVMNPVDQGFGTYQPGDLSGLAALYQANSCG